MSVIERRDFQGAQLLTPVVGSIGRRATFGFFFTRNYVFEVRFDHLISHLVQHNLSKK